jgi:hypothetical protein
MPIANDHRFSTSLLLLVALTLTWSASAYAQDQEGDHPLGEPRADLERFYGVYGDPDNPGRDFFVKEAEAPIWMERLNIPPGYLMIGAMWGDVAPWYMKSLSETEFEQGIVPGHQEEPLAVTFELGEDSTAVALTFKMMFDDRGRLERIGDLPERWR